MLLNIKFNLVAGRKIYDFCFCSVFGPFNPEGYYSLVSLKQGLELIGIKAALLNRDNIACLAKV